MRRALLFAGCLGIVTACDPTHEPTVQYLPERLAVHSVLVMGDTLARVLVTRVGGRAANAIEPVPNAVVSLSSGNDIKQLTVVSGLRCINATPYPFVVDYNDGCYTARFPGGLQAGATYTLRVEAGPLGSADGVVTLPVQPAIVTPAAGARLPSHLNIEGDTTGGTVVRWEGVSVGRLVELSLRPPHSQCTLLLENLPSGNPVNSAGPHPTNSVSTTSSDSLRVKLYDGSCGMGSGGISAAIVMLAFDSTYTRYRENFGRGPAADPNLVTGINGAVGVFAGAARAVVPITLTRN